MTKRAPSLVGLVVAVWTVAVCMVAGCTVAGCTGAAAGHAPANDAGMRDAPPLDGWEVIAHPPIQSGRGDAGHDAGRVTGSCAARLLVIFDRSLSMQDAWPSGTSTAPKWQIAETALADAVSPRAASLSVGAILFPSGETMPSAMTCAPVEPIDRQIPFESGTAFLAAWSATWRAPTLYGSTPIDAAFDAADAALAGAGSDTAVVLLTDGQPTCSGSTPAVTRAAAWSARGIRTWVVGLPGSSGAADYLGAIASAGGTGTALSVDDPSALTTALGGIAGGQVQSTCGP